MTKPDFKWSATRVGWLGEFPICLSFLAIVVVKEEHYCQILQSGRQETQRIIVLNATMGSSFLSDTGLWKWPSSSCTKTCRDCSNKATVTRTSESPMPFPYHNTRAAQLDAFRSDQEEEDGRERAKSNPLRRLGLG